MKTCKQRIKSSWNSIREDLKKFLNSPDEATIEEFNNYALSIDEVKPNTFKNQPDGYLRYQISFGGPTTEIRFFNKNRIEYWFLDWFDGAKLDITKDKTAQKLREYLLNLFNDSKYLTI